MKSTGLLIAAALLAALTGTLYWSDHHKTADATAMPVDAAPKIFTLKDADLSKIEIKKKGTEEVALAKNDAGKWQITSPAQLSADQDAVSSMASTLSSLNSERVVEDKASDLKQYGLTEPAIEVDIATKDGKSQKLLLGDDTPAGNAVFAATAGDPRVFTIASYTKTSIDKSPSDLRDKRLLTADFDKISQVELDAKKQSIEFGRNKDAWQILKPRPLRADNFTGGRPGAQAEGRQDGLEPDRRGRKEGRLRVLIRRSGCHCESHRCRGHARVADSQEQGRLLREIKRGRGRLQNRQRPRPSPR